MSSHSLHHINNKVVGIFRQFKQILFIYSSTRKTKCLYCMCEMQTMVILVTVSCHTVRLPVWLWGQFNRWNRISVWNHLLVSVHWLTEANARFVNISNKYLTLFLYLTVLTHIEWQTRETHILWENRRSEEGFFLSFCSSFCKNQWLI